MARPSNRPTINQGSVNDLLNLSKQTKNKKQARRYLIIRALMLKDDLSIEDCGQLFGVAPKTVTRLVKSWNERGVESLKIIPQPGRKRKFTDEYAQILTNLINNQHQDKTRLTAKSIFGFLKG